MATTGPGAQSHLLSLSIKELGDLALQSIIFKRKEDPVDPISFLPCDSSILTSNDTVLFP